MVQGIKVTEWDAFLQMGKDKPTEPVPPKPDDPATIMYTSGTTGGLEAASPALTLEINRMADQIRLCYVSSSHTRLITC